MHVPFVLNEVSQIKCFREFYNEALLVNEGSLMIGKCRVQPGVVHDEEVSTFFGIDA
jgi:hypothetical protein